MSCAHLIVQTCPIGIAGSSARKRAGYGWGADGKRERKKKKGEEENISFVNSLTPRKKIASSLSFLAAQSSNGQRGRKGPSHSSRRHSCSLTRCLTSIEKKDFKREGEGGGERGGK